MYASEQMRAYCEAYYRTQTCERNHAALRHLNSYWRATTLPLVGQIVHLDNLLLEHLCT